MTGVPNVYAIANEDDLPAAATATSKSSSSNNSKSSSRKRAMSASGGASAIPKFTSAAANYDSAAALREEYAHSAVAALANSSSVRASATGVIGKYSIYLCLCVRCTWAVVSGLTFYEFYYGIIPISPSAIIGPCSCHRRSSKPCQVQRSGYDSGHSTVGRASVHVFL